MRCIIVEDEKPARELLEDYVNKVEDLTLSGAFRNALTAHAFLQKEKVDLMFLDIQMPDLTGLELLRLLPKSPLVIMTTAYKQYALESYEFNVIDYLVKPIALERFIKSVQKAKDYLNFLQQDTIASKKDFVFIKTNQKIVKIATDDILYLEGYREYIKIHTNHTFYLVLMNFKEASELLPPPQFLRIHRSFIVNLNRIEHIEGNLIRLNGKDLKVSASYKNELLEYLSQHNLLK